MVLNKNTLNSLLQTAIDASVLAGKSILEIYDTNFSVETKDDHSPLTKADKASHKIIMASMANTKIPILSEEGLEIPYQERKNWPLLWIVDPLDGTKEFVKKNGEFTVNIALIEHHLPILGVIYVPVTKTLFFSHRHIGSFKVVITSQNNSLDSLLFSACRLPDKLPSSYTIVSSRSHTSPETEAYIQNLKHKHGDVELTSMGSSLKICLVAEGIAHEYPRFAPTMEWDTAAGHAIAKFAGKSFIDYKTQTEMQYNRENLKNNWFLVK